MPACRSRCAPAMQQRVIDDAVRTELIRQRTHKLAFEASDGEVLASIREVPAFQVDGKFSPDAYRAALQSIGMTPERFEAEQRQFVLARQLDRGIYNSAFRAARRARAPGRAQERDPHARLGHGAGEGLRVRGSRSTMRRSRRTTRRTSRVT